MYHEASLHLHLYRCGNRVRAKETGNYIRTVNLRSVPVLSFRSVIGLRLFKQERQCCCKTCFRKLHWKNASPNNAMVWRKNKGLTGPGTRAKTIGKVIRPPWLIAISGWHNVLAQGTLITDSRLGIGPIGCSFKHMCTTVLSQTTGLRQAGYRTLQWCWSRDAQKPARHAQRLLMRC